MINANLEGVDFLIANTDAQALQISKCPNKIQLGLNSTKGLGAGMRPDIGKKAAEEAIEDLIEKLEGSHMLFIAAGMGGGTGTGAAPVIAKLAREKGILTVGVVTKPFHFEGSQRMKLAEKGIEDLQQYVDTLLTIPNQNLFRIANEKTTFSDAFKMADDVLYAGVRGVTDLMVQPGMINLDFSDIKTVMSEMGKAMMGTGEASGEGRAIAAAEAAIANPLIDDVSLKGAKGLIINITGGKDITLYEVDEAANRIKQEIDEEANIIYGTTCDDRLEGLVRVSIVATGIDARQNNSFNQNENFAPININNEVYKNEIIDSKIENNEKNIFKKNDIHEDIELDKQQAYSEQNLSINDINIEAEESDLKIDEKLSKIDDNIFENIEEKNVSEMTDNSFSEQEKSDQFSQIVTETKSDENTNNPETSVRRLSLFDSMSSENLKSETDNDTKSDFDKSEPTIAETYSSASHSENSLDDTTQEQSLEIKDKSDDEFNPEEMDLPEIDEEFNQETEEELLDIPTFLRRQAN